MMARFFEKKGFRVLIFDNRGAGKTESEGAFSLEDVADDLGALISALAIKQTHLVGFSMGGIVARCFAHKDQTRVKTLSLVSTPFNKDFLKNRSTLYLKRTLEEIEKDLASYVAKEFFDKNKLVMISMARKIFSEQDCVYEKSYLSQREAIAQTAKDFFILPEALKRIQVIHGDLDEIIPLAEAQKFKEQDSRVIFKAIVGAGHLLLIEKTRELYQSLLSFIS